jgi:hypothetical protein
MAKTGTGELVSMKRSAAELKDQSVEAASAPVADAYPYGLAIQLEDDQLEKLGLDTLPKVGATLMLRARVTVRSVSTNESADQQSRRSVSLQITDLAVAGERRTLEERLLDK